jgi:hypothetical protein
VRTCFGVFVKADMVRSTSVCGLPLGIAMMLVTDDQRVYFACKRNELTTHTYATSNRFLPFWMNPPIYMRVHRLNHFEFKNV